MGASGLKGKEFKLFLLFSAVRKQVNYFDNILIGSFSSVLQILPKILFARCSNLNKKALNKYGLVDELNGDAARPYQTARVGLARNQLALVREKSKYTIKTLSF